MNPHGIREVYDDLFEFDQIKQWIEDYERELQDDSIESKIIEFDFDFAEKLKIEVRSDFWKSEERNSLKENEIKMKLLI